MDLLSLVLAKQPLQRLLLLPRLLRQRRFLLLRSVAVNGRTLESDNVKNYILTCTKSGELTTESEKMVSPEQICYRAAFLHNEGVYKMYCGSTKTPDVWMGLATGVPRIQAVALVNFIMNAQILSETDISFESGTERQLTRINWTSGLREAVRRYVIPVATSKMIFDVALFGYLQLRKELPKIRVRRYNYFRGFCLAHLKGEEKIDRDDVLEAEFVRAYGSGTISEMAISPGGILNVRLITALIRGGYTKLLVENIEKLLSPLDTVLRETTSCARTSLLGALSAGRSLNIVPRAPANLGRIRRFLDGIPSHLGTSLRKAYRIVLGERVDISGEDPRVFNNLLFTMGIPTFSQPFEDYWSDSLLSNCVLYDSAGVLAQNWNPREMETDFLVSLEWDAYRLGRGTGKYAGTPPIRRMILNGERGPRSIRSEKEVQEVAQAMVDINFEVTPESYKVMEERIQSIKKMESRILNLLLATEL